MSNEQKMVSVPRDEVERLIKLLAYQAHPYPSPHAEYWQGLLDKPAEQHQGETVTLPERKRESCEESDVLVDSHNEGWNACLDEIAKLGPLYTHPAPAVQKGGVKVHIEVRECEDCNHIGIDDAHSALAACHECDWSGPEPVEDKCPACGRENVIAAACPDCGSRYVLATSKTIEVPADAGEVERLRQMNRDAVAELEDRKREIYALRAQLAEREALLRIYESFPGYLLDNCEGETVYEEHLQHWLAAHIKALSASAEPSAPKCNTCNDQRHVPDGAITGVGGVEFENGPVECIKECPDCTPSAPVECDGRAEFEKSFVVQEGVFFSKERNEYRSMNGRSIEETDAIDLTLRLSGWQARAALERKS